MRPARRIGNSTSPRKVRFNHSTMSTSDSKKVNINHLPSDNLEQSPSSILNQLRIKQTQHPTAPNISGASNYAADTGAVSRTDRPANTTSVSEPYVYSPIANPRNEPTLSELTLRYATPAIYTTLPALSDLPPTMTSIKQQQTMKLIMKNIDQIPLPSLDKPTHIQYLLEPLDYGLSGRYVSLDASRPWMLYWCLNALAILGEDVGQYTDQLVSTLKPLQSTLGGFGGGNGQWPHLAATYASLLSLTICTHFAALNTPKSSHPALYSKSFSWIDRKRLLKWLKSLKLSNGGFKVNSEGEEDVRAVYCILVSCAIMCFDKEELICDDGKFMFDGTAVYLSKCQTWEGGLGAKEDTEAHGGYAFCVVAGLCLLGEPGLVLNKYLDVPGLISWLSARQYAPEGGLSGRTNKLVDGCYSTWVGGCWSLLEAAVNHKISKEKGQKGLVIGSLWNRQGLIRYILACCQDERGGLKDKPGMRPDQYHTNYVLIGLSSAQHYYSYNCDTPSRVFAEEPEIPFAAAFDWKGSKNVPLPSTEEGYGGGWEEGLVTDQSDRIAMQHPVFNIPLGAEQGLWTWWTWWRQNGKIEGVLVED